MLFLLYLINNLKYFEKYMTNSSPCEVKFSSKILYIFCTAVFKLQKGQCYIGIKLNSYRINNRR